MVVWKNTTDGVQDNGLTLNGNSMGTPCSFTARNGWIHLLQHIAKGLCAQADLLDLDPGLISPHCQSKFESAMAM